MRGILITKSYIYFLQTGKIKKEKKYKVRSKININSVNAN